MFVRKPISKGMVKDLAILVITGSIRKELINIWEDSLRRLGMLLKPVERVLLISIVATISALVSGV